VNSGGKFTSPLAAWEIIIIIDFAAIHLNVISKNNNYF